MGSAHDILSRHIFLFLNFFLTGHYSLVFVMVNNVQVEFFYFRQHDWFKIDLPKYLFPSTDNQGNHLDDAVISEICEVSSWTS